MALSSNVNQILHHMSLKNLVYFSLFSANIKVFYDTNFAAKFGTGSGSVNAIRRILAHTQHILKWPSLITKVVFNAVYGVEPINEKLNASEPL